MFFKKVGKKEYEDNKFLSQNISNEIIRQRADSCLKWFICKAVKNKYWYYSLSVLTIICPVISEIIINISDLNTHMRIISSIILGISTIAASFLTLFDVRRKWGVYRNEAEELKRILSLFEVEEDDYDMAESDDVSDTSGDSESGEMCDVRELSVQEKGSVKRIKEKNLLIKMENSMDSSHKKWLEPFNNNSKV